MYKALLSFILTITISTWAFAQETFEVSGQVFDVVTKEPLPAGVELSFAHPENKVIQTEMASISTGSFTLRDVTPGQYQLIVTFIGFKQKTIEFQLTDQNVNLESILLEEDKEALAEVEVMGARPDALIGLDKRVFDVSEDINSRGGQAADVLQNIPSVNVDIDGNISLRGSENVRIWIDGRPSTLVGLDDQSALQQIPASMIERVEIITNPSSKYDADGTAGIINIVTKKEERRGWNGTVAGGVGSNSKYDASSYLSRREGNWTFFTSYGFNRNYRDGYGHDVRENFLTDTTFVISNNETSYRNSEAHNFRLGTDWQITPSDVIGFTGSWNIRERTSPEFANYESISNDRIITASLRDVEELRNRSSQDLAVHYEHDPKGENGEKWVADLSYSRSLDDDFQQIDWVFSQFDGGIDSLPNQYQRFDESELEEIGVGSLDYERRVQDWGRLELGWKSILQSSDEVRDAQIRFEENEPWMEDTLRANAFQFHQNIHAVYGNLGWTMGLRWKAQLGVRLEQAFTASKARSEEFPNDYFNAFPSGFLTYLANENQEFQLSYSRRINRPGERQLNPTIDYEDPQNLRAGNPNLQPEYINSTELSHIWYFAGGSLSSAIYYQYATNVFTRFRRILPDGRSFTTFENLNQRIRWGAEATAQGNFTSWLSGRANINLFQSYILAENVQEDLNQSGFSWFTRVSAIVQLPWELQSQWTYNYLGSEPTGQGFRQAITSLDIALSRDFFNDQLNVSMRLSDVFNTRQFEYRIRSDEFNEDFLRKRESRIFYVNLTYRFGTERSGSDRRSPSGGTPDMDI